jgi:tetratricopeptide (TPR) repeat protein
VLVLGYAAVGLALLCLVVARLRAAREPEPAEQPAVPEVRVDLEQLASEVELSPSFHNRVRMGWALLQAEQATRAQGYFEQALATHAGDKQALSRLVERSFAYEDYEAALALVEAHVRAGQNEPAAELLAQVAQESGRLEHQLALARHHVRLAQRTEAQDVLRSALSQFDLQPAFLRQRNGAAATEARRLLRMLEQ